MIRYSLTIFGFPYGGTGQ